MKDRDRAWNNRGYPKIIKGKDRPYVVKWSFYEGGGVVSRTERSLSLAFDLHLQDLGGHKTPNLLGVRLGPLSPPSLQKGRLLHSRVRTDSGGPGCPSDLGVTVSFPGGRTKVDSESGTGGERETGTGSPKWRDSGVPGTLVTPITVIDRKFQEHLKITTCKSNRLLVIFCGYGVSL